MTEAEFQWLAAQGYNRIPLVAEALADLDTPLSLYLKLANGPYTFLLESVVGGERFGRYSFIGLPRASASAVARRARCGVVATRAAPTWRRAPRRRSARVPARLARSATAAAPLPGRRASAAASRATSATTPCATSSRTRCGAPQARSARHCPTCCCCDRGARGHRQPARQALPDRLRRSAQSPTRCARAQERACSELRALAAPLPRELPLQRLPDEARPAALESDFAEADFLAAVRARQGVHPRRAT